MSSPLTPPGAPEPSPFEQAAMAMENIAAMITKNGGEVWIKNTCCGCSKMDLVISHKGTERVVDLG